MPTSDYNHGGPSRYTSVGDGGGECGSNADGAMVDLLSLGFFFDIDAKLILIHTKSREGINILILAYKHVYTSTMSKALFWLLAPISE